MKIGHFEFSLRELSGAMGDFGTLFPLAIGYIAVCGLNPAGLLVTMGLANIITGIVYRLPMPIEPMKVLAVVAIAQQWPPSLIYASGLGMGIIWLLFAVTGVMDYVAKYTPRPVIRGIQVALGVLLALETLKFLADWWLLGAVSVLIVILHAKTAMLRSGSPGVAGISVTYFHGDLAQVKFTGFTLPEITFQTGGSVAGAPSGRIRPDSANHH